MRVMIRENERGVVGAIAALLVTAMLAMGALVIDVGHSWQARRQTITATDAAALAAAHEFAEGSNGCASVANDYLLKNSGGASLTGCVHVPRSGSDPGWVNVSGEVTVDFIFAPVFGVSNTTVQSSTTVSYQTAGAVTSGIRPFGLCLDTLNDFSPPPEAGDGEVYLLEFGKDDPSNCGGASVPGNWALLDFDGGGNSVDDLKDWTRDGYQGTVSIGDTIEGSPGAYNNALTDALNDLLLVDAFTLPIYDTAADNGANALFNIVNLASVRLHGFKGTGSEDKRYIEIEFIDAVVQGTGGGPEDDFGAMVIAVCAVDGVDPIVACS